MIPACRPGQSRSKAHTQPVLSDCGSVRPTSQPPEHKLHVPHCAYSHSTAPSHTAMGQQQETKWNSLTCFHDVSRKTWERRMLSQKELQGQITNTVNCFLCEEAIGAFCSLSCFDLCFIWQHLFPFLLLLPLYQFSGCNEPMKPMRYMFYQANSFVTTSYNQSCSTQGTTDQK